MNIEIKNNKVILHDDSEKRELDIGSREAFNIISQIWLRSGWDTKYVYSFTWLGRPIIQLPEDMIRIQEIIWTRKPDVIIETGIAHGGSLVFYASILNVLQNGRIIGVDIDIREHNRIQIESHPLYKYITMFQGSSVEESVFDDISKSIKPEEENIMVILDSNHSRDHVFKELQLYSSLVSIGSYIVVCDGIMKDVVGAPRTNPDWDINNPISAINDFLSLNKSFELCEPPFLFNEGLINKRVTYWPSCYLRRVK